MSPTGDVGEAPETQQPAPVEGEVVGTEEVTGAEEAPVADEPLDDHEAQAAEYLALAQRTQADFENFRKRSARDTAAAEQRGMTKVVKELLPALDDLERALAATPAEDRFAEGVKLVHAQLTAALNRVGVEGYSPKGEPFDPTVHEAITQQPVEGAEPGTVVEVYQQGWRKDGFVIRPARVVVAA